MLKTNDVIKNTIRLFIFLSILSMSCNNDSSAPTLPNTSSPFLSATGPNVLKVQVGSGQICGKSGYINEPCTSVTICVPGTSNCQTISDILVDTGSVGLRLFSSTIQIPLPPKTTVSGNTIAQCAEFGIGSDWGPLATADVKLGGESAVTVPIQVIDKTFAKIPTSSGCTSADTAPQDAGYNGILGVGQFVEDCGQYCETDPTNAVYFSCSGATCTSVLLPPAEQLQNPVAHLPIDNNGLILALPQVTTGGTSPVEGVMILGIGTSGNNSPNGFTAYSTDSLGNFSTSFNGSTFSGSFIDSGSNGYFFPNVTNITLCSQSSSASGFYCPDSLQTLKATNFSASNGNSTEIQFYISNAEKLVAENLVNFSDIGGVNSNGFDWGLPFFYGRAVFQGISGKSSVLGNGPYLAY